MLHVKGNILVVIENLSQVLVHVTHDEEDALRLLVLAAFLWHDDVQQLDGEDVVLHGRQAAKDGDLPVDSLDTVDVVECVGDVLDSHSFVLCLVRSFDDLAEAALALDLDELVVLGEAPPGCWQAL